MGAVKPGMYTNTLLLQQQMLQVTCPPPTQLLNLRHATRLTRVQAMAQQQQMGGMRPPAFPFPGLMGQQP
jgi:hypothetical protein